MIKESVHLVRAAINAPIRLVRLAAAVQEFGTRANQMRGKQFSVAQGSIQGLQKGAFGEALNEGCQGANNLSRLRQQQFQQQLKIGRCPDALGIQVEHGSHHFTCVVAAAGGFRRHAALLQFVMDVHQDLEQETLKAPNAVVVAAHLLQQHVHILRQTGNRLGFQSVCNERKHSKKKEYVQ